MKVRIGPSEVIFIVGFICLVVGIMLLYGVAWGLIAAGSILLITAFRNASEREPAPAAREKG